MLTQLNLFEIPPKLPPKPQKGKRCKDCKFLFRHMYNSNLKYCQKQRAKGTATGCKKIGSNNAACIFFEPIEKK